MKRLLQTLLLIISVFVLLSGCKKDDDNNSHPPGTWTDPGDMTATVSGRVLDEDGNPVGNADIAINTQTTITDQYGLFILKNISVNSRCIVSITKTGYFNRTHAFIAKQNTVNYIKAVLISNAQTHTLSGPAGGTVTLADGSSIQFGVNSFVEASTGNPYMGTVSLCVKHLSPAASNFGSSIPGNDLLGKSATGLDVALYSYGMLGVELKGSIGQVLQLAPTKTATIIMPIATSQILSAPYSIPLWYFDETTSLWKEEGSAARIGMNYVGTVTHFTWWNCDYSATRARIIGKVLDCNSVPVPNCVVTVNGIYTLTTDQSGVYQNWVPTGISFTVQVLAINNNNVYQNSQVETVPALTSNQTYYVADFIVPCPARITGTLKKCTGETIDGMIIATWTGGSTFQYSSNGTFNFSCPPNTSINLVANYWESNILSSYYTTVQSQALNVTVNVGDILMCNQQTQLDNDFTINGGPLSNYYAAVTTDSVFTWPGQKGGHDIYMDGYYQSGIVNYYQILIPDEPAGSYPWATVYSGVYISFRDVLNNLYVIDPTVSGWTQLTYAGPAGDRVIGSWSGTGNMRINSDTTSYPVAISGHFNVIRDY
jgi:hypothetical protein